MFRLSFQTHALHLMAMAASIALLRVNVVAKLATFILSLIPTGISDERYVVGPGYEPLSALDWVVHICTMVFNLEILASLSERSKANSSKRTFAKMGGLFFMSHIQGWLTLASHSMIDVNKDMEISLFSAEAILMRTAVFGTGLVLLLDTWSIVPAIAALVSQEVLKFNNPPGIVCSTLSILVIVTRNDLPKLFRLTWVSLSILPALVPDPTTDHGHTVGAVMLNAPLALFVYSLSS